MTDNKIVQVGNKSLSVPGDVADSLARADASMRLSVLLKEHVLIEDLHYGSFSGSKPVLLKGGAEIVMQAFNSRPKFTQAHVTRDFDRGLFDYVITCEIINKSTGEVLAEGMGSASTFEDKYRMRWLPEQEVPSGYDKALLQSRVTELSEPDWAIRRRTTEGKYAKTVEYWDAFETAIADGTAKQTTVPGKKGPEVRWSISSRVYRVPNPPDVLISLDNTVLKMAQKRAMVAAALTLGALSDFFTQDMEDAPYNTEVEVVDADVWNAQTATAWSRSRVKNPAFGNPSEADILKALGVTRLGEWTGTAATADVALKAHMANQPKPEHDEDGVVAYDVTEDPDEEAEI